MAVLLPTREAPAPPEHRGPVLAPRSPSPVWEQHAPCAPSCRWRGPFLTLPPRGRCFCTELSLLVMFYFLTVFVLTLKLVWFFLPYPAAFTLTISTSLGNSRISHQNTQESAEGQLVVVSLDQGSLTTHRPPHHVGVVSPKERALHASAKVWSWLCPGMHGETAQSVVMCAPSVLGLPLPTLWKQRWMPSPSSICCIFYQILSGSGCESVFSNQEPNLRSF